jgi:hypothetical protein
VNRQWYRKAEPLERCTQCNKPLTGAVRMLEYDQRDGTYHDRCDVPEEKSQGWFPFGVDCARRIIKASAE